MGTRKARGAGEGSVYKERSTGRWRVAVRLPDGRVRRINVKSQAEGIAELRAFRAPRAGGSQTLNTYARHWLGEVERARVEDPHGVTPQYVEWERQILEGNILPVLGSIRLGDLEVSDVAALLKMMATDGGARTTIKGVRGVLARLLDQAAADGAVDRNAARLARMPAGIQPSKQKREAMTVEQARALLEAVKGRRLEALFTVALMLGLRPGELLGLRWSEVDLEAGTIRISASLKRDGTLGPPKTEESVATLDAPAPVVDALRAHKARQAAERLRTNLWVDHDIVFASRRGTPTADTTLRRMNADICDKAGLGKWTPHEYRHTAGSLLLDAGVSREEVRRVLRHKNQRMLDEVYGHEVRPTVNAAVAPMERIFG